MLPPPARAPTHHPQNPWLPPPSQHRELRGPCQHAQLPAVPHVDGGLRCIRRAAGLPAYVHAGRCSIGVGWGLSLIMYGFRSPRVTSPCCLLTCLLCRLYSLPQRHPVHLSGTRTSMASHAPQWHPATQSWHPAPQGTCIHNCQSLFYPPRLLAVPGAPRLSDTRVHDGQRMGLSAYLLLHLLLHAMGHLRWPLAVFHIFRWVGEGLLLPVGSSPSLQGYPTHCPHPRPMHPPPPLHHSGVDWPAMSVRWLPTAGPFRGSWRQLRLHREGALPCNRRRRCTCCSLQGFAE